MGWDEKTSLGTSGKRANEPITVVKRSGKAGLGSFRSDNSRILNAKANICASSISTKLENRDATLQRDGYSDGDRRLESDTISITTSNPRELDKCNCSHSQNDNKDNDSCGNSNREKRKRL